MAKFSVNTHRFDPYRNFKFKIKWDNQYVAGLSKCSALKKTIESTDWREGGDPSTSRKLPGKTSYEPITLEAGVTHLLLLLLQPANRGFEATLRACAYSRGPWLLLALPCLGLVVGGIYSLVVRIIGVAELHDTTKGRAALAVLLPPLTCTCLSLALQVAIFGLFGLAILATLFAAGFS